MEKLIRVNNYGDCFGRDKLTNCNCRNRRKIPKSKISSKKKESCEFCHVI